MKTLIHKDLDKFTTTKLLMRKEAKDFYEAERYLNKETEVRWKKQMEPPPSPPSWLYYCCIDSASRVW